MKVYFPRRADHVLRTKEEWLQVDVESQDEALCIARGLATYLQEQARNGVNWTNEPELLKLKETLEKGGLD